MYEEIVPVRLREILSELPAIVVAFSGGLDSRFLCHSARLCGCQVLAIHIKGPHVPERESRSAEEWARRNRIPLVFSSINPLSIRELRENGKKRCYFCKRAAFGEIKAQALKHGAENYYLCDGGNSDDSSEYRPGQKAVKELGFISPLSMAGLGKREIHHYAQVSGLENPGQKARPCLLTRFSYGVHPDLHNLARLEKTEEEIETLLASFGIKEHDFRVRIGRECVLQINPIPYEILDYLRKILSDNGFTNCDLKFMDRISGYYDRISDNRT